MSLFYVENEHLRLVVDVGTTIIGIRAVNGRYFAYYEEKRIRALERLESAVEIITYNGKQYDFMELDKLSRRLRSKPFSPKGSHTDIRELFWPGILGSSLNITFNKNLGDCHKFPDTYEGSNMKDVYQTLALWRHLRNQTQFIQDD